MQLYSELPSNPRVDLEQFIATAEKNAQASPLDPDLRKKIDHFKRYGNDQGYLVISGLATDPNAGPTPISRDLSNKKTHISEFNLTIIGSMLGDTVTYEHLNNGAMFHDVCPLKAQEDALSSRGSKLLLHLHSDLAFHPHMPDYLLLFCLRQNQEIVPTSLSSIRLAMKDLTSQQINLLRQPLFKIYVDDSFTSEKKFRISPILTGPTNTPFIKLDADLMKGITNEAQQALQALITALKNHIEPVALKPGDLLIIDNKTAVHGRNSFKAKFDGTDRWYQRVYVVKNRAAVISDTNNTSRCIHSDFSQYQTEISLAKHCQRFGMYALPIITAATVGFGVGYVAGIKNSKP